MKKMKIEEPIVTQMKKHVAIRNKYKIVNLPEGISITWIESNAVEVNDSGKTILYDSIFKGFTNKQQFPIFEYVLNQNSNLLIRSGDTDYIYTVNDEQLSSKIFRHPQDLRK